MHRKASIVIRNKYGDTVIVPTGDMFASARRYSAAGSEVLGMRSGYFSRATHHVIRQWIEAGPRTER